MKKRILSIVCVVALIATMISAGAIYAFGTDDSAPSVLYGTGFEFNSTKPTVAEDWTFSHAQSSVNASTGGVTLSAAGKVNMTATYKDTFILTDGFTLTYVAHTESTNNIANNGAGMKFVGVKVGNIEAYLTPASASDALVMEIAVDGTVVATNDILDENNTVWTKSRAAYFFSTYMNGSQVELNYNPDNKTVSYTLTNNDRDFGTLTYTDAAETIDLEDAELGLASGFVWGAKAEYKSLKLDGATCTSHVYDDNNDTTCNKCSEVRQLSGNEPSGNEPSGNEPSGNEPATPKGDALTEAWAPKTFVDTDWTGDTSAFKDGRFVMSGGSENAHKDVWTAKSYDLSAGFKFKGTLTMKNGNSNYYGEWCSAYFGDETNNIELRIKNDGSRAEADAGVKIDTYTAILLCDNAVLATYKLGNTPNGEYEVTYKDGKVSVALKEVKLDWTLADSTTVSDVPVTADLSSAKIGLRLTGNYGPENGREWKLVNLAPIPTNAEGGEDVVKGETLTSWEPEKFVEADWLDSEGKFDNGEFLIATGGGTKTIWTTKNYDMSGGFKFKGTLAMKNGYNNYFGEWCSAYFGNELVNLELRIKNDTTNNDDKDNTYTAYILYNGKELASSDLLVLPNGEYELTYKDGKVAVSLGGVALKWTLTAGGEATSVDVAGANFSNAKLGLRLTGNYCPNGRKWSAISLTSLSGNAAVTGDARNIVLPAVVMLVCAVSVAFVLLKKKSRA